MTIEPRHPRFSDPVAMRPKPPARSPTTIQPMTPIGPGRYWPVARLCSVVPAIGLQRVTPCLLQRSPNGGETAAAHFFRGLVELPLRVRVLARLEQLQLSFHVQQYPQGV